MTRGSQNYPSSKNKALKHPIYLKDFHSPEGHIVEPVLLSFAMSLITNGPQEKIFRDVGI